MITYNGLIMTSDRDFIEAVERYDMELAEALREYLPYVDDVCGENDWLWEQYNKDEDKSDRETRELKDKIKYLDEQIQKLTKANEKFTEDEQFWRDKAYERMSFEEQCEYELPFN